MTNKQSGSRKVNQSKQKRFFGLAPEVESELKSEQLNFLGFGKQKRKSRSEPRSEMNSVRKLYKEQAEALHVKRDTKLSTVLIEIDKKTRAFNQKFDKKMKDLTNKQEEKAQGLDINYEDKVQELNIKHYDKAKVITVQHDGEVQELSAQYGEKSQVLSSQYDEKTQALSNKYEKMILALKAEHEEAEKALEIERQEAKKSFVTEHEKEKKLLEAKLEKAMRVNETQLQKAKEPLETRHSEGGQALQIGCEKEMGAVRAEFEAVMRGQTTEEEAKEALNAELNEQLQLARNEMEEKLRKLQIQDDIYTKELELNKIKMEANAQLLKTMDQLIKDKERLEEAKRMEREFYMTNATESPAETDSENSAPSEADSTSNADSAGITTSKTADEGAQDKAESTKTEDEPSQANSNDDSRVPTAPKTKVGDSGKQVTPSLSSIFQHAVFPSVETGNTTLNGRPVSERAVTSQRQPEVPEYSETTDSPSGKTHGRNFTPRAPPKRHRAASDVNAPRKIARQSGELEYNLELMAALATTTDKVFTFNDAKTEFVKPDLVRGVPTAKLQEGDRRYWLHSWVTLSEAFEKISLRIQKKENAEKDPEKYVDVENQKEDCIYLDESKLSFVKSMVGADTKFHPNQLLKKTALTEDGLCNSHGIHHISRYLSALRSLKENGVLRMEPEEFLRWRVILICERLKTDVSLPVKTILKHLDTKNKEDKYGDPVMAFAVVLAKDKEKMRGFLRTFITHKACGLGATNDLH